MSIVAPEPLTRQALEFLKNQSVMALATSSLQGEPQASSVYYTVDDDFNFYFLTGKDTRKEINLKHNPRVAFLIGTGPSVITIQGGGTATLLPRFEQFELFTHFSNALQSKDVNWPLTTLPHKDFAGFRIKPEWLVLLDLSEGTRPQAYQEGYQKII
ncbi:MAG: pyridoxamine 5'-phosphate oxidase family protein [Patescibacteria group bacterium]